MGQDQKHTGLIDVREKLLDGLPCDDFLDWYSVIHDLYDHQHSVEGSLVTNRRPDIFYNVENGQFNVTYSGVVVLGDHRQWTISESMTRDARDLLGKAGTNGLAAFEMVWDPNQCVGYARLSSSWGSDRDDFDSLWAFHRILLIIKFWCIYHNNYNRRLMPKDF